ncbi:sphingomyelin phosphodiesterase [Tenacibaculum maritimum]|uniref:sphingomyelin phosphodiesterase n=1 Tax=Tenacibaculum maritimum TaxID=107401 RepID=UPI0038762582
MCSIVVSFFGCQNDYEQLSERDVLNENLTENRSYSNKKINDVNILTYNIHAFLISKKDEDLRFNRIKEYIKEKNSDHDIILFTEIWVDSKKEELINEFSNIYPYSIQSNKVFTNIGDGLLILSKIPIGQADFKKFTDGAGWDWFSDKGFWKVEFRLDNSPFYVFLTHTQADENQKSTRIKQLKQIKKEMSNLNEVPVIIAGDLNVIAGSDEYDEMLSIFNGFEDSFIKANPNNNGYTYNNQTNKLAEYFDGGTQVYKQRLDYILYSKGAETISSKIVSDCKYTTPSGESWDCSDHYGVASKLQLNLKIKNNDPFVFDTLSEAVAKLNDLKRSYGTGLTSKIVISNHTNKDLYYSNKTTWYGSTFYSIPPSKIPAGKHAVTLASHDTGEATGVFNQLTYLYDNSKEVSFGTYVPWSDFYTNNILTSFQTIDYNNLAKNSSKKSVVTNNSITLSGSIDKGNSPFVFFSVTN